MAKINNPMEIFKLLNGSNCRHCNEKTCLAFAVAVFKGRRELAECPYIEKDVLKQFSDGIEKPNTIDEDMLEAIENLKQKIPGIDLAAAAERLGAKYNDGKLTIKVMGKDFSVDQEGRLITDIHVNPWIAVPVLTYILNAEGKAVSGNWISFRELKDGQSRYALFQQRCEKPLKKIADTYSEVFKDMLDIFSGKRVDNYSGSDVSIVLRPLPLVPILVCYWAPEDGLESDLYIFFDENAEHNLDIDTLYTLVAGIVHMFEKLSLRHGVR